MGLLILQSTSSVVLDKYELLLRDHLFVTLFLTMLVGAGACYDHLPSILCVCELWVLHSEVPETWHSAKQAGMRATNQPSKSYADWCVTCYHLSSV